MQLVSDKEKIDTTTHKGKFALTIFAVIVELEREFTIKRIREGVAVAKEAGKLKAGLPAPLMELIQSL